MVTLRNRSPLGAVDNPLIGRIVDAGEEFDVPTEVAGEEPKDAVGEPGHKNYKPADLGSGLLAQAEHFERVTKKGDS